MKTEANYALAQAKAQLDSIESMVAALNVDYDKLNALEEKLDTLEEEEEDIEPKSDALQGARKALEQWHLENNANGCKTLENAEQRIQEDPLCIEVRSGWTPIGDTLNAEEFKILLCTGGPAVQIIGELDENCAPTRAQIQYQDWWTPWTDYINHDPDKYSALIQYCQQFYYGK